MLTSTCSCKHIDFTIFPVVSFGDYKGYDDGYIMCPDHHPFFIFAAGIAHTSPNVFSSEIYHAWYSTTTYHLKVFVKTNTDFIQELALYKAWNIYWNKDYKYEVSIFHYDTGHLYCYNAFQSDDKESVQQFHREFIKKLLDQNAVLQ
jgi:hypothetical protein